MKKTNTAGRELIKDCESVALIAYMPTPNDVWTIGVGHTRGVTKHDTCTIAQAELWFTADLRWAENCVDKCVDVPLNSNQFSALVSFTFNLGCGALLHSTLLRFLNDEKYALAADQFRVWNKQRNHKTGAMDELKGLTIRRAKERELFLCLVST